MAELKPLNISKILLCVFFSLNLLSFDDFIVNDIRIAGLQRVSTGSIFNTIPISVGDKIDQRKVIDISKALPKFINSPIEFLLSNAFIKPDTVSSTYEKSLVGSREPSFILF